MRSIRKDNGHGASWVIEVDIVSFKHGTLRCQWFMQAEILNRSINVHAGTQTKALWWMYKALFFFQLYF